MMVGNRLNGEMFLGISIGQQGGLAEQGISDIFGPVCAEDVCGEGADAREDAGVFPNTRSVLGHGHVANVVGPVLDSPMSPDGGSRDGG